MLVSLISHWCSELSGICSIDPFPWFHCFLPFNLLPVHLPALPPTCSLLLSFNPSFLSSFSLFVLFVRFLSKADSVLSTKLYTRKVKQVEHQELRKEEEGRRNWPRVKWQWGEGGSFFPLSLPSPLVFLLLFFLPHPHIESLAKQAKQ